MPMCARFLPMAAIEPHRVAVLCLEPVVAFDLSTPPEVFSLAWRAGRPPYEPPLCAPEPGPVATTTGFEVQVPSGLEALESADTILVPGYRELADAPPTGTLAALRTAAARGARMTSICTGAYALAHAGLLDGRRAT